MWKKAIWYSLTFPTGLVVLLFGSSFVPSVKPPEDRGNYQYCYEATNWFVNRALHGWCAIIIDPEPFIAIFTLLIAGYTLLLWMDGKKSSERGLRAYVVAELGWIENVAEAPKSIRERDDYKPTRAVKTHFDVGPIAFIQIKNTGQTPAKSVIHWGTMEWRRFPLKGSLKIGGEKRNVPKSVIGPGIINTKDIVLSKTLTYKQEMRLRRGSAALFVWGTIAYEDFFGNSRETKYRFMHYSGAGNIGVNTSLSFCENGNSAT